MYIAAGATSNLVTFQMGNIDNGYQATVVLRIADVFGDYVELRYSVIVSMFLWAKQFGWFLSSGEVFVIPPAKCVCGRVYCFHVVRPSIRLCP